MDSGRNIEAGESKRTEAEHRQISEELSPSLSSTISNSSPDSSLELVIGGTSEYNLKKTDDDELHNGEHNSDSESTVCDHGIEKDRADTKAAMNPTAPKLGESYNVVSRKKELKREFKEMISQLPDEPTLEDYLEVPVEGFGHHYKKLYSKRRD